MQASKKNGKGKKKLGSQANPVVVSNQPVALLPQLDGSCTAGYHLRFSCNSNGSPSITVGNLVNLIAMLVTSTSEYPIFDSVKVKRIRVVDNTGGVVAIRWKGGSFNKDTFKSSEGNASFPSVLDVKPPPLSAASFWNGQSNLSTALFTLTVLTTSTIDLWISGTLAPASPTAVTTPASFTVGNLYFWPLDGPNGTLPSLMSAPHS